MSNKFKSLIIAFVFIFIFLTGLLRFAGPATGYWDTYISAPALFLANHPVNFISLDGETLYQYRLLGKLPDNLVDRETYGIISKDQRLGTAVMFTPWFVFFNLFGFRLLFGLSILLTAWFVFLAMQLVTDKFGICIFAAIVATLNSYSLSLNKLNPNIMGMMLISILLYLVLSKNISWLIIGLFYGLLCGVREVGILFFPALTYRLFISSYQKKRDALLFILGTLITIAPILYWNYFAFGNILTHPTQFKGLEGFRPVFEHRLLFWRFNFNGMLNYPFYEKIVRTPYFSFPVFLLLPLTLIGSFGIILSALVFLGAGYMLKKQRHLFIFIMLWFLPVYILFSIMENWSQLKTTFLLLFLNPIIIFMGYGIEQLLNRKQAVKNILNTAILSIILWGIVKLLFYVDFPSDPRWYMRFPRVLNKENVSYIGDDLRTKREDPQDILTQKKGLTQANLFPRIYLQKINIPDVITKIKKEIPQRDITVIDFWKYIYEP